MFGNIAVQVIGYYTIAFICIPLGYGHLRLQSWSRKVALTLLWDWMIFGLPLSIIFFLMLLTSKALHPSALPFLLIGFFLVYPIMPVLLTRLYRHRNIRSTFQNGMIGMDWTDSFSESTLILISLVLMIIVALHVPLFFNGIFPLFSTFAFGLQGYQILDLSILILAFLLWGLVKRKSGPGGGHCYISF